MYLGPNVKKVKKKKEKERKKEGGKKKEKEGELSRAPGI